MSKRRTRGKATPNPLAPLLTVQAAGVVLMALGAVTLLSLLSPRSSALLAGWVRLVRRAVGLETVVVPFVLGALGIRLFVGRLGRPGAWGGDRTAGAALLGLSLAAGLHMALAGGDPAGLAAQGGGGGAVGWAIGAALQSGVGAVGAWIVVIACTLASILLLLRVSVSDLAAPFVDLWRGIRGERAGASDEAGLAAPSEPPLLVRHAGPPIPATRPSKATPHVAERAHAPDPVLTVESALPPYDWVLPSWEQMLEEGVEKEASADEIRDRVRVIEETLTQFGVPARVVEVNQGPTVTQFGVEPGYTEPKDDREGGRPTKVKVSRISALSNDLSLALSASPIRVEAPVPGRSIVGIEVPNSDPGTVSLRSVVQSEAFAQLRGGLKVALGQDVSGRPVAADLAAMPHLLIAGATGSGKSVCLSAVIASLLLFNTPEDLRLIMADPKRVELSQFGGIPHLLAPVVVDMERFSGMLHWATREMDRRYRAFGVVGARNLEAYNAQAKARGTTKLPYVVLLVDELADLMLLSPDEVERSICRIAQMARATGIHLVLATQRPSVDVVTGLIKANFPARIAFAVTSQVDSRVILDMPGAEKLLGRGDLLYMASDTSHVRRLQGCYVSDSELARLVAYWVEAGRIGASQVAAAGVQQRLWPTDADVGAQGAKEPAKPADGPDPLLASAEREVRAAGKGSIALLQRLLRIGYSRAAGLMDGLVANGVLSTDGTVLMPGDDTQEARGLRDGAP